MLRDGGIQVGVIDNSQSWRSRQVPPSLPLQPVTRAAGIDGKAGTAEDTGDVRRSRAVYLASFPEADVLLIFGLLLLIWLVLMGFLFAWTLWFQAYIYTEPATQLWWRAPAAGTAIAFFLAAWVFIDYRAVKNTPDARYPYGPIQEMPLKSAAPEPFDKLYLDESSDAAYTRTKVTEGKQTRFEYRRGQDVLPSRPQKVVAVEGDEKVVFEPDRDAKGNFKPDPVDSLLRYRDSRGRVLYERTFEREAASRTFAVLFGLFLNAAFLAVWFACMWLLLRYQLWHALGLAVVMYGVMLLFVIGPVMATAEEVARPKPVMQATS
jgi:hypothetical protein